MKMLNGNISCKSLDNITEKRGGIIVPTKDKSYKTLEIVEIDSDITVVGIEKGAVIYVPLNSGNDVEVGGVEYTIVNAREIILIVD